MSDFVKSVRNVAESADRAALNYEEEAVEVASQWAQEKLENFLHEVESASNDPRLLKISYIISRRSSIDVFTGKSSDIGQFAKDLIKTLADGKVMEGLGNLAGTLINKLFGSASGSAQTERIYEVTFDELGGLNRLDAFFFCYRFSSSGITNMSKAVIGTCIVRSAANMVDDNAYRVVLTSSATLAEAQRTAIGDHMIEVAKNQKQSLNEHGQLVPAESTLLEARAKLAKVIGEGVATSEQYISRKQEKSMPNLPFRSSNVGSTAEKQAAEMAEKVKTVIVADEKTDDKNKPKQDGNMQLSST